MITSTLEAGRLHYRYMTLQVGADYGGRSVTLPLHYRYRSVLTTEAGRLHYRPVCQITRSLRPRHLHDVSLDRPRVLFIVRRLWTSSIVEEEVV